MRGGHSDSDSGADHPSASMVGDVIYHDIERRRRLRLVRFLAPTFAVLQFLTLVGDVAAIIASPPKSLIVELGYVGSFVCFTLLVVGTFYARRERINAAVACVLAASTIAVCSPSFGAAFLAGVGPTVLIGLASYSVLIVLVGVLTGSIWLTLASTVVVNVLSAVVIWLAPYPTTIQAALHKELAIFGPLALATEWAFALLLIAALRIYTPTFRELGEVRAAYARSKQLEELKDQFISSVNHELRNPVMAMLGYLELLRLTNARAALEQREELIADATQAGEELRALLASILDARRLDQGAENFVPEVVDVLETLKSATRLIDPREGKMVERDLRLRLPSGLKIWGSRTYLQQIFTNLLSNALKYSASGTPVEVTGRVVVESQDDRPSARGWPGMSRWGHKIQVERQMAELVIRDYGKGIPQEQVPLLFQRFVRLPRDLASTVIGNGLGLYLCRVFASAMKGHIWVESSGIEGEGSTFYLRLPLPPTSAVSEVAQALPEY